MHLWLHMQGISYYCLFGKYTFSALFARTQKKKCERPTRRNIIEKYTLGKFADYIEKEFINITDGFEPKSILFNILCKHFDIRSLCPLCVCQLNGIDRISAIKYIRIRLSFNHADIFSSSEMQINVLVLLRCFDLCCVLIIYIHIVCILAYIHST